MPPWHKGQEIVAVILLIIVLAIFARCLISLYCSRHLNIEPVQDEYDYEPIKIQVV